MPSFTVHTVDVAVMVSSSSPSSPRKTSADAPRSASTPATMGAIRASATPVAWAATRAGLVSGPRKLNGVGTPSSFLAEATWRRAGWNFTAKQKVMPASTATSATRRGVSSRLTPSSPSTSEAPLALEAARLPCLTTVAPVPATTMADIVEMLTVLARSPPVPTMSTVGPGTSMRLACSYMVRTRPAISSTVSPLARRATAKPAICTSVASPRMMRSMAQAASSVVRSRPAISVLSTSGQVCAAAGEPPAGVTTLMGITPGESAGGRPEPSGDGARPGQDARTADARDRRGRWCGRAHEGAVAPPPARAAEPRPPEGGGPRLSGARDRW